jgi:hypothetical protein
LRELEVRIAAKNYSGARIVSADFMQQQYTVAERRYFEGRVKSIPFPEQPVLIWNRHYLREINPGFKVNLDTLTHGAMMALAWQLARRERSGSSRDYLSADSYLFDAILHLPYTEDEKANVIIAGLLAREAYVNKIGEDYQLDRDFTDTNLLDHLQLLLTLVASPLAVEAYLDSCARAVENGVRGVKNHDARAYNIHMYQAFRTVRQHPELLDVWKKNLPTVKKIKDGLEQLANTAQSEYARNAFAGHLADVKKVFQHVEASDLSDD